MSICKKIELLIQRDGVPENISGIFLEFIEGTARGNEGYASDLSPLLIRHGARFPDTNHTCRFFSNDYLEYVFETDNIEYFNGLVDAGFDPAECSRIAVSCITTRAIKAPKHGVPSRTVDRLIELDCDIHTLFHNTSTGGIDLRAISTGIAVDRARLW